LLKEIELNDTKATKRDIKRGILFWTGYFKLMSHLFSVCAVVIKSRPVLTV